MTRRIPFLIICLANCAFIQNDSDLSAQAIMKTKDTIKLGMSAVFSGPTSQLGDDMYHGMMALFHRVNQTGGVHGRKIELIALDDGYTPSDAEKKVKRLIHQENVLALIGCVGTPTAKRTVPIAIENKVLYFGGFSGAEILRPKTGSRYLMNFRASYRQEVRTMVKWLIQQDILPHEMAFFTQADQFGTSGYEAAMEALEHLGADYARRLPHGQYHRNQEDITEAVYTILTDDRLKNRHPPKAIIMVGAYRPCAGFIRMLKPILPDTHFINISFVGALPLVDVLGKDAEGVIISQVVPSFTDQSVPVVKQYQTDFNVYLKSLGKTFVDIAPCFVSLEGYLAAQQFVLGLMFTRQPMTRESLIDGIDVSQQLEKLSEKMLLEDLKERQQSMAKLGVLPQWLRYKDNQMSQRVWMTRYSDGKFINLSISSDK